MRTAFIVAGLGYGDEGKGATVDFLCRTRFAKLVVRYNGGPQAGHNVVTPEGKHHTFSQFGSGTFVPGCRTFLSRFVLVNPLNMMTEENHLHSLGITDAWGRTAVDARCVIVTPFHRAVNRIMNCGRHNSCGMGVGQARADHLLEGNKVLFAGDIADRQKMIVKLKFLQSLSLLHVAKMGIIARKACAEEFSDLSDPNTVDLVVRRYEQWPAQVVHDFKLPDSNIVFEGAQGVLIDEHFGDQGFNTWTNTTFANAIQFLGENNWTARIKKIGVLRTYLTRHGEGPFSTEDPLLDLPEPHNDDCGFQGKFRRGHFNLHAARYAIKACDGIDGIALNHCDLLAKELPEEIARKIIIRGYGPTANDRAWEFAKKREQKTHEQATQKA